MLSISNIPLPLASFAAGLGGQRIYVILALDLVVVTTASLEHMRENPKQEWAIHELMPRFILPAILDKC